MNNLPVDVYREIFHHLPFSQIIQMSYVNKEIHNIVVKNLINLDHEFEEVCNFSIFTNIITLKISFIKFTDEHLLLIVKKNNFMENIDMQNTEITDNGLIKLGETNHLIKKINISGIKKITDHGCIKLFENNTKIIELNIGWTNITDKSIEVLLNFNKNIHDINVSNTKISKLGIKLLLYTECKYLRLNGLDIDYLIKKKIDEFRKNNRLISYGRN